MRRRGEGGWEAAEEEYLVGSARACEDCWSDTHQARRRMRRKNEVELM
jgi:hypothetical protein